MAVVSVNVRKYEENVAIVKHRGYQYEFKSNPKANDSTLVKVKEYMSTATGACKFSDLLTKGYKLGAESAHLMNQPELALSLQRTGSVFSKFSGGFILAYFAWTVIQLKETAEKLFEKDKLTDKNIGITYENIENLAKDTFSCSESGCITLLSFVSDNVVVKSAMSVTGLGANGIELKQEYCKWHQLDELSRVGLVGDLTPEVQSTLEHKKQVHFFGLVKTVCSLVGGIFGAIGIFFAITVVPPITTAVIGLTALIFNFIKHFHNENMVQKLSISRVAI